MALITYQHTCPSCGVVVGQRHDSQICDISRCADHGDQFSPQPGCRPTRWLGYFPGQLEAVEYGFFCHWDSDNGWVTCGPEHPEAMPDLNRLVVECDWDREIERFIPRQSTTQP